MKDDFFLVIYSGTQISSFKDRDVKPFKSSLKPRKICFNVTITGTFLHPYSVSHNG